jgi:Sulfotransferase family
MAEPLIVLAPPRSFTSVISTMLGQHPQMYGFPEVHLFAADTVDELFQFYRVAGKRRQHGLLRVIAELFVGEQSEEAVRLAKNWLWRMRQTETRMLFIELVRSVAPCIVVEKSVSTIWRRQNLVRLSKTCPGARFIHLTRHPRSQCKSMLEAAEHEPQLRKHLLDYTLCPPKLDPQVLWHRQHSNIVEFLTLVPPQRKLLVRGEDVLNDPDTALRQVAMWLGLRSDATAVEAMKHPERSPFAKMGPANARFGNDPKFLKDPVLRSQSAHLPTLEGPLEWRDDVGGFWPTVTALAREFGYS